MIIGITGGKGGTGKSTVATAISYELSKTNSVLLVDMDVDCPNDHLILGIDRKKVKDVFQRIPVFKQGYSDTEICKANAIVKIKDKIMLLDKQCNGCGSCKIRYPNLVEWDKKIIGTIYKSKKENIDFLSGELKISEPVSEFIVNEIKGLISEHDYVVIDTAAGTHCDVISALEICDMIFCVTEPTPLGIHDAELILKLVEIMKKPYEVILNRYEDDAEILEPLLKKYNKKTFFKIPYNKKIIENYSNGNPIQHESINNIVKNIKTRV